VLNVLFVDIHALDLEPWNVVLINDKYSHKSKPQKDYSLAKQRLCTCFLLILCLQSKYSIRYLEVQRRLYTHQI